MEPGRQTRKIGRGNSHTGWALSSATRYQSSSRPNHVSNSTPQKVSSLPARSITVDICTMLADGGEVLSRGGA